MNKFLETINSLLVSYNLKKEGNFQTVSENSLSVEGTREMSNLIFEDLVEIYEVAMKLQM